MAAIGCAGTRKPADTGSGGGASSGNPGAGGSTGAGLTGGSSATGTGGAGQPCQTFTINFEPKIPTVFVLVDRSGSSTQGGSATSYWKVLRAAALDVMQSLQAQVRFGLGVFTGVAGGTCPIFDTVAADLNNYGAIQPIYMGLDDLQMSRVDMKKGETPASKALAQVRTLLAQDTSPGDKYILFVTDGETDYCDDGSPLCGVDSVVAQIQSLKAAGVGTLVLGVLNTQYNPPPETLKAFANAGAGEPVYVSTPSTANPTPLQIYYDCSGRPGWNAEYVASGKTTMTALGSYVPTAAMAGNVPVFAPTSNDQQALRDQIASAVAGVKSCTFDLAGRIKVDLTQLAKAGVKIEGQDIALSDANGWHMLSPTQLELVGTACATWRDPDTKVIDFNFPCEIITPG